MTKVYELANKLNQELLQEDVIKEFKKYEALIKNDTKLNDLQTKLKALQKQIVRQKADKDDSVEETIQHYQDLESQLENYPILVNYLNYKEEVDILLQNINNQLNSGLEIKTID